MRVIDVGFQNDDAMFARAAHELGGSIKAHRLRVQQGTGERCGIMAFEPSRVAFGKAVLAEPLDLIEAALGKGALVAALDHARHHLLLELTGWCRDDGTSPSPS